MRTRSSSNKIDLHAKWLETDGLGGFSSGTVSGIHSHRSQGLVVASKNPPLERYVLVNGFEAVVSTSAGDFPLIRRRRADDSGETQPQAQIIHFETRPWPKWRYLLPNDLVVEHEILVRKGMPVFVFTWKLIPSLPGTTLRVRPMLSGRRLDQLQTKNPAFNFDTEGEFGRFTWKISDEAPTLSAITDGEFTADPRWYEGVAYEDDIADDNVATEDLGSPGAFSWHLDQGKAHLVFDVNDSLESNGIPVRDPATMVRSFRNGEKTRRQLISNPLQRSCDHYIVERHRDKSLQIIASYPAGGQRTSDALVALRGICLSSGRFDLAGRILTGVTSNFTKGVLPSQSSEYSSTELAQFDSPDPTLWFILTAFEFLAESDRNDFHVSDNFREELKRIILRSLADFEKGNSYGMYVDDSGLLAYHPPFSSQFGGQGEFYNVATQALWLNAAWIGGRFERHWKSLVNHALPAFANKFWFEEGGYLRDSFDPEEGSLLKARQILAVGGLPKPLLDGFRSSLVLKLIEDQLWTPYGLRIARTEPPNAAPLCSWLLGPFVEAWIHNHRKEKDCISLAKKRFIAPWQSLLGSDGLDHIGESSIDTASPDVPFYAPATAELLRILNLPQIANDKSPPLPQI